MLYRLERHKDWVAKKHRYPNERRGLCVCVSSACDREKRSPIHHHVASSLWLFWADGYALPVAVQFLITSAHFPSYGRTPD